METTQIVVESPLISLTDLPVHMHKKQPAEYDLDQCIAVIKREKVLSDVTPF
jgi:hypothetical protein